MNTAETKVTMMEVACASVVKLGPDFLQVAVKPGINVDVSQMEELSRAYDQLVGRDEPFYIVTLLPEDLNPSKELRDHWRTPERSRRKLAEAVVIRGIAMMIIANFVHKMERPGHRVKYFKSDKEAIAWIEKIRVKDSITPVGRWNNL